MTISSFFVVPLFLVAFVLASYQYWRLNPDRRLLNLRFGLMAGAVILIFLYLLMRNLQEGWSSVVLFALGLLWLGISALLLRTLPPRKQ